MASDSQPSPFQDLAVEHFYPPPSPYLHLHNVISISFTRAVSSLRPSPPSRSPPGPHCCSCALAKMASTLMVFPIELPIASPMPKMKDKGGANDPTPRSVTPFLSISSSIAAAFLLIACHPGPPSFSLLVALARGPCCHKPAMGKKQRKEEEGKKKEKKVKKKKKREEERKKKRRKKRVERKRKRRKKRRFGEKQRKKEETKKRKKRKRKGSKQKRERKKKKRRKRNKEKKKKKGRRRKTKKKRGGREGKKEGGEGRG